MSTRPNTAGIDAIIDHYRKKLAVAQKRIAAGLDPDTGKPVSGADYEKNRSRNHDQP